jgi:arginase
MPRSIAIIGAPTSAGAYSPGQEEGPQAMRDAGLADGLRERGLEVVDLGDVPRFRWRPDRERPGAMNVPAVASAIVAVAEKVASAVDAGQLPLVLGGDCTIELGTVLGMRRHLPSLRLVYLDAHPDLNTPESVVDGALDWMGVAHLLDIAGALPELAGLGPRMPLLDADELVLLGNSPRRTTEHERQVIAERGIANVPEQVVAAGPAAAAEEALRLVGDGQGYLVHLDTDVIDFAELPLAENTDRNAGLAFETVMRTLDGVLAGDGLAALTVSELDPHHGAPDGTTVRTFVDRLTASFAARAFA